MGSIIRDVASGTTTRPFTLCGALYEFSWSPDGTLPNAVKAVSNTEIDIILLESDKPTRHQHNCA